MAQFVIFETFHDAARRKKQSRSGEDLRSRARCAASSANKDSYCARLLQADIFPQKTVPAVADGHARGVSGVACIRWNTKIGHADRFRMARSSRSSVTSPRFIRAARRCFLKVGGTRCSGGFHGANLESLSSRMIGRMPWR